MKKFVKLINFVTFCETVMKSHNHPKIDQHAYYTLQCFLTHVWHNEQMFSSSKDYCWLEGARDVTIILLAEPSRAELS